MLALNQELLSDFENIFIKKQQISIDRKIQSLIKYLHLPVLISTHQKSIYKNPAIAKQGGNLFKVTDKIDDDELVKSTKLKIMLNTKASTTTYLNININNNKLAPNFTATYIKGERRNKAIEHIKALLEDANSIKIFDKYLSSIDSRASYDVWQRKNLNILKDILPQKNITIDIYCDNDWNSSRKQDLENIYNQWNIQKQAWDNTIHDRYIVTDKVSILLSSGVSNMDDNSSKDFTYIVKVL